MATNRRLPEADICHVLAHLVPISAKLSGTRLFVTGGSGFFGKWLLECIASANDELSLDIRATVLSREPARVASVMPELGARPEFTWLAGDVRDFTFPPGHFDYVIHLATAASEQLNKTYPQEMLTTIVVGTQRVLEFARHCGARRLLLASSGAVYGPQPENISLIPEDFLGGPNPLSPTSAYAEGKRMAELFCSLTPEVECLIARGFAFIGPHLPLDAHFAAGNFLRDALAGGPIVLKGDGRSVRSYLHAADLTIWLMTILLNGKAGRAYNIGSNEAVTTLELAQRISNHITSRPEVHVLGIPGTGPVHRYVPDISRAKHELNLAPSITLDKAISRSIAWLRQAST